MSLLIDNAPKSVNIDGAEVEINSDFRTAILFEQMMFDEDFPEHLKIANALQLFYPVLPNNLNEAVDKLIWFYSCGKDRKAVLSSPKVVVAMILNMMTDIFMRHLCSNTA